MKKTRWIILSALAALCLFLTDSGSYAQRGGRAGGRAGGGRPAAGARTGSVRTGAAVGPYGGVGAARHTSSTVVGPGRSVGTAGSTRGSYTTNRGTTVNYGGVGRTATGPAGVTAGRGVGAVQVTTPGGREV